MQYEDVDDRTGLVPEGGPFTEPASPELFDPPNYSGDPDYFEDPDLAEYEEDEYN